MAINKFCITGQKRGRKLSDFFNLCNFGIQPFIYQQDMCNIELEYINHSSLSVAYGQDVC